MGQIVFIPREIDANEPRVAASPDTVKRMAGLGFEVIVEAGAGAPSRMPDADFANAGRRDRHGRRCRRAPTWC